MHFAAADPLTSSLLLRDFTLVLLGALGLGLAFHAVRRLISRRPAEGTEETQTRKVYGVDASHFTWWDFLICSVVLCLFLTQIFLPDSGKEAEVMSAPEIEEVQPVVDPVSDKEVPKLVEFIGGLAISGMLAALIVSMIQWVGMREPSVVFGLRNCRLLPAISFILIGSSLAILAINMINGFSVNMIESIFGEVEVQAPVKELQQSENSMDRLVLVLSAVVVAPLFEELVFRGYFYGILKKFTEPMFGAFLSGGIFAVIHGNIPAILPLWFFGIFLALAYEASRSLWVPIGIHAIFNGTTVIQIFQQANETAGEVSPAIIPMIP